LAAYHDEFESATGNDNYWLGLDKVYHLMQLATSQAEFRLHSVGLNELLKG